MIETLDQSVGRVLKAIKDLNLEEETIVVFTSDNGGNMYSGPEGMIPTNNYPLRGGKGINYEGGVRIPMMVRVPGLTKAGEKSNVVTTSADHFKTLLELAEVPYPEDLVGDGESYVKALKGMEYERGPYYSTFCHNVKATGNRTNISMRQGPWRFYKFYFDGAMQEHRYELYKLDEDIGEKNNLADKTLRINSKGNKPSVETGFVPNISDSTFYLKFEMKSNSKGEGSVAWMEGKEETYSTEKASAFKSIHDNRWHSCRVEIPLTGLLKSIKIQPSSDKGSIEIKNITLVTTGDYYIRDWPLY